MLDRSVERAVVAVPGECPAVKRGGEAGLAVLELDAQQLREEMVEAVPLAAVVERHYEEVRARELVEERAGALLLEHGIAEATAHALEDRRAEHERLHRGVVCLQHVADEEIDPVTAPATESA